MGDRSLRSLKLLIICDFFFKGNNEVCIILMLGQISMKNKTPIKVGHKRASDILFSVKAKA